MRAIRLIPASGLSWVLHSWDDEDVQANLPYFPFTVVDKEGDAYVQVRTTTLKRRREVFG